MADVTPRRALVTGASRGIGRAIALALAGDGANLALLARTTMATRDTAKAVRKLGRESVSIGADLRDPAAVQAGIDQTIAALGGLDVLVHAAGVSWMGPSDSAPPGAWSALMETNLVGAMEATRLALPHLLKGRAPALIFIASISAITPFARGAAYAASKHGLLGFAQSLYEELRGAGLKVSTICPGNVNTEMTRATGLPARWDELLQPEDVADAVRYILSTSPRACPTEIVLRCHHGTYL